jgi:hypothetical protein
MRPKLVGPSEDFTMSDYTSSPAVLRGLASAGLHAFTYHSYGTPSTAAGLDSAYGSTSEIVASVMPKVKAAAPSMEMWLGEGGGIGGSGVGGVSNAFADSLWYADTLGNLAKNAQQRFQRQTIAGGHYGLVNLTTTPPSVNPDFYVALLFAGMMGPEVLQAAVDQAPSETPTWPRSWANSSLLSLYSHTEECIWANTRLLANLTPSSLQRRPSTRCASTPTARGRQAVWACC